MPYNTIYQGKEFIKKRVIATIYPSKTYSPLLVKLLSEKNDRDLTAVADYVYTILRNIEQNRKINNDDFSKALDKAFEEYAINKESLINFTQSDLDQLDSQEDNQTNRLHK